MNERHADRTEASNVRCPGLPLILPILLMTIALFYSVSLCHASGPAATPRITFSPASVNFGTVKLGVTSTRAITITNTGAADLVIGGITITGANASEFGEESDCVTITAGSSCVVSAAFTPVLTGGGKAKMTVSSNDPSKPAASVKLTGTSPALSSAVILDGAFDNLTTYPDPEDITYTRKDGTAGTEAAFPGLVVVLTTTKTAVNKAVRLITKNGGAVVKQIPNIGFYVASIASASLDTFLSAMYASAFVVDAFPSGLVAGRRTMANRCSGFAGVETDDENSLIQTIDGSSTVANCDLLHKAAVGTVAGGNGVDVHINDNTVYQPETADAASSWDTIGAGVMNLLVHAQENGLPVIINISMGAATDTEENNKYFYAHYAEVLDGAARKYPGILKNAVILFAGSDKPLNETATFTWLREQYSKSPIWNSLYFVESQEGTGSGSCDIGYADIGAGNEMNVLSAPGCNVKISSSCTASGTSFSTPAIANLIAQAYEDLDGVVNLAVIAKHVMKYQKANSGALPTVAQLVDLAKAGIAVYPESASFDKTGGKGSVAVTASGKWKAVSHAGWITITSKTSATGNGTVTYAVAANGTGSTRTGTMTIAGVTVTVTQSAIIGVTGYWYGTLSIPGAPYSGCGAETVDFSLYLTESGIHRVTGYTSNSRTIESGSRSGKSVTVTLTTNWGERGPYAWTWDGGNTLTGSMAYFCYDLTTLKINYEGTETFSVTRD